MTPRAIVLAVIGAYPAPMIGQCATERHLAACLYYLDAAIQQGR